MYVLAIDTATNSGGAALSRNEEVIGSIMLKAPLRYSDSLIETVDFLLRHHDLRLADVGCLSVAAGPGSFTGLRIGLAAVKAFGQALSIPAVGLSTLEALAWRYREHSRRVAALLDARRQQIYGAAYEIDGGQLSTLSEEAVAPASDWLKTLPADPLLFVGDGARLYQGAIAALRPESRVLSVDNCVLEQLCQLGFRSFCAGLAKPVSELRANYVRPSGVDFPAA